MLAVASFQSKPIGLNTGSKNLPILPETVYSSASAPLSFSSAATAASAASADSITAFCSGEGFLPERDSRISGGIAPPPIRSI